MKKGLILFLVVILAFTLAGCGDTSEDYENNYDNGNNAYEANDYNNAYEGNDYNNAYEEPTPARISDYVLESAMKSCIYRMDPFSISVGELLRKAVSGASVIYYNGDEMIEHGICGEDDIDASIDKNNVYYAIISGEVMRNPDIPYMTQHEEKAMIVLMVFDENQNVESYDVQLSETLRICAIQIMT